ncbi:MAG: lysophospholipid acyltransferase family protein [Candidatus Omnitrophica bacterium]|nr:lysophospholipid acyltransferase family protein [Candidatus Omnitrophota bacterium]
MIGQIALYRLGSGISVALPRRWAYWVGERLGDAQWRWSARDRRAVQTNLSAILERPVSPSDHRVREVFRNFARYLVEFFRAFAAAPPSVIIDGREHLESVARTGHGGIVLSAHLGNWELGGMLLSRMGLPFSAVALRHRSLWVNRFFDRQRTREGIFVIPLGPSATRECLARIRHGGFVAILGDREFGSNGIPVRFLGRRVPLPRGPALLSLRTGAPVIPVLMIREGQWRFRLVIAPPIWPTAAPASAGPAALAAALTQEYAGAIERYIRRFPTQWLMFAPLDSFAESRSCSPP